VVLPHRSACYHCHAARVAGQQGEADAAIAATPRADSERIGFLHGHVELTVTRLARNLRVVHADAPDAGAILCYVFSPFGLRRWPVERDRACPRCGAGALAAPRRPSSTPLAAVVSR
jgi:hypothetical protein